MLCVYNRISGQKMELQTIPVKSAPEVIIDQLHLSYSLSSIVGLQGIQICLFVYLVIYFLAECIIRPTCGLG